MLASAREDTRRSWISSYRLWYVIFLVCIVYMYACMRDCIRPYRIDIHERAVDCRHDAIKRITILRGAAMLNVLRERRCTIHNAVYIGRWRLEKLNANRNEWNCVPECRKRLTGGVYTLLARLRYDFILFISLHISANKMSWKTCRDAGNQINKHDTNFFNLLFCNYSCSGMSMFSK